LTPIVVAKVETGYIRNLRPEYYQFMKKYGDDTGYMFVRDATYDPAVDAYYIGCFEPWPYVIPSIGSTVHAEGVFHYTPTALGVKLWVESED